MLERLAVFGTLAAGSPEGIAVVLAVKGLGRFGELKVPAAPERFMIGTFASVLWACACWAVALAVAALSRPRRRGGRPGPGQPWTSTVTRS